MSSASRRHSASWRSFSSSGKSAAAAATPIRSIWPASRPSTIRVTSAHRFPQKEYEFCGSRTADSAFLDAEEPQDVPPQNPEIPAFRTADSDVPEPQNPGASNTDFSQPDTAFSDVSPSVPSEDGPADDEKELTGILDACELSYFEPEVARVFENAIERLFIRTICVSGRPFCHEAGCGRGCTC